MIKTPKTWILSCSTNFEDDFQCNKILSQNRFHFFNYDKLHTLRLHSTIFQGIVEGLITTYAMNQNHEQHFHINNSCFRRKALEMR
jgi:hypothetical protein